MKEELPFIYDSSLKSLRILNGVFIWLYLILCLISFCFYQSPSFPLCTASKIVSWNIHKILSINSFSNVFIFGDLQDHHKASWNYTYRADILGELLYFSISYEDSQLVNFLNQITDCDICSTPILGIFLDSDDNDDNDDHDEELFLWYGWPTKDIKPYFQPGPLSEILTIANLQYAASRIWTCTEPEFKFCWMKLCSSDNHYTMAPDA